jgi:oligopeptidase B
MRLPLPPIAKKIPHTHVYTHGSTVTEIQDNYHWMKDQNAGEKRPEIIQHLNEENEFAKQTHLEPNAPLIESVYSEFLSRLQEDDSSVPVFKSPYYYYTKTVKGLNYPIYCRKFGSLDAEEQVYLDLNLRKEEYLDLGYVKVSPNHRVLAYSLDTSGDEVYGIHFVNLDTGEEIAADCIQVSGGSIVSVYSKPYVEFFIN